MKKYKILFYAPALNDLKEARRWYNAQQQGLGLRLIKDVKEVNFRYQTKIHIMLQ